jgi:mRNA-degrading endonuclease RelE of RelBE toxin-antitoxin system
VSYSVLILRCAAQQLAALSPEAFVEVRDCIRRLSTDPLPTEACEITAKQAWRVGAGLHRVIYRVDSGAAQVTVLDVGRRSGT